MITKNSARRREWLWPQNGGWRSDISENKRLDQQWREQLIVTTESWSLCSGMQRHWVSSQYVHLHYVSSAKVYGLLEYIIVVGLWAAWRLLLVALSHSWKTLILTSFGFWYFSRVLPVFSFILGIIHFSVRIHANNSTFKIRATLHRSRVCKLWLLPLRQTFDKMFTSQQELWSHKFV